MKTQENLKEKVKEELQKRCPFAPTVNASGNAKKRSVNELVADHDKYVKRTQEKIKEVNF